LFSCHYRYDYFSQVVKCWRPHMARFSGSEVLTRYGLPWVLMAGGVLAGKLVRFGYPHELGTQLEAARLGAQLLSSVFTASATHPQRALGLATYTPVEVRVSWTVTEWAAVPTNAVGHGVLFGP
jgi:hypothetical protein